jgi:hypothetical protein
MTRLRVLLVTATIAGPIALSLAALVLGRMLWPFSDYPMYSDLAGPTVSVTRAVGVESDGRERPLPPQVEPTGLVLHLDVNHASRSSDAPARLTRIATAMWAEYERLRAACPTVGLHSLSIAGELCPSCERPSGGSGVGTAHTAAGIVGVTRL